MPQSLCDCDVESSERDDPLLPPYMTIRVCPRCGMWAEYDTEAGEYRSTV